MFVARPLPPPLFCEGLGLVVKSGGEERRGGDQQREREGEGEGEGDGEQGQIYIHKIYTVYLGFRFYRMDGWGE
jgi:hypothetical protein